MRGLTSLLDFSAEELRRILDWTAEPPAAPRPLDGHVVAVLTMGPAPLPSAAWVSAASRLGASVLRLEDLDHGEDDAFALAAEAARWADLLVLSHPLTGFARAVADTLHVPTVNAGESGGEDPAAGVSLLATVRQGVARLADVRVAVCGDLAGSRSARAFLSGLATLDGTALLVPAEGLELHDDHIARLGRRLGGQPVRFPARSMDSLLDMVDTVLLAHEESPQLPLFDDVGVPPGEAALRARRHVEDLDYLFVAASGGGPDRLVHEPFRRSRALRIPEGSEHRVGRAAVEAVLRFVLAMDPTDAWPGELAGATDRYRAREGLQCRGMRCVQRHRPDLVDPDFAVVGRSPQELECLFCGERTVPTCVGSRLEGRFHPLSHGVARSILPENRVLFRHVTEALDAGFEPSRGRARDGVEDAAPSAAQGELPADGGSGDLPGEQPE